MNLSAVVKDDDLQIKLGVLEQNLRDLQQVLVAFSGGTDSSFLLAFAVKVLGSNRVLAVTGSSDTVPRHELDLAKEIANSLGAEHSVLLTEELQDHRFTANPLDRCYYCKNELFTKLGLMASQRGISYVLDGSNADDEIDWRPGLKAAMQMGVRSPLRDAGLRKDDIRQLSREMGLSTWNKPASPCLSSRFPYQTEITSERLKQVESAETILRQLNIRECRVRYHGEIARIEVPPDSFKEVLTDENLKEIIDGFRQLGFSFITLDIEGFRSGRLNEGQKLGKQRQ